MIVRDDGNKMSWFMNLSAALFWSMCKAAMSASVKMALPGDPTNAVWSNCVRNPTVDTLGPRLRGWKPNCLGWLLSSASQQMSLFSVTNQNSREKL